MLRFEIGELALTVGGNCSGVERPNNALCIVKKYAAGLNSINCDYVVSVFGYPSSHRTGFFAIPDRYLKKLPPHEEKKEDETSKGVPVLVDVDRGILFNQKTVPFGWTKKER